MVDLTNAHTRSGAKKFSPAQIQERAAQLQEDEVLQFLLGDLHALIVRSITDLQQTGDTSGRELEAELCRMLRTVDMFKRVLFNTASRAEFARHVQQQEGDTHAT